MRKPPLLPVERAAGAPLSYAQEGLWFLQQLDVTDAAYTLPVPLWLAPDVDTDRLHRALTALVSRHEMLRTRVETVDGVPWQRVGEAYEPPVDWHDGVSEAGWERLLAHTLRQPFDLASGRLVRGVGARLSDGTRRLCLAIHHIAADGWSLRVLARDLAALYAGAAPAPPAVQYADFALWQRGWLAGAALGEHLAFWRDELAGCAPLELPADFASGRDTDTSAGTTTAILSPETTAGLLTVARAERATGFVVAATLVSALLGRWADSRDVVFGSVLAGRGATQLADVVGNFVNSVTLRVDLSGDPSYRDLLRQARGKVLNALRHQDAPFDKVVAEVAPRRDLSRHPIFSVALLHQDFPDDDEAPNEAIRPELRETAAAVSSRFDLEIHTVLRQGQLANLMLYRSGMFAETTMRNMARRLVRLAEAMAASPDVPIATLDLTTEAERRLIAGWSVTASPLPARTVPEIIAAQTSLRPYVAAVATATDCLTYAELDARSATWARWLRQRGVARGQVVAVHRGRDPETIAIALGVNRCGAAFLLLDPADPAQHRAALVAESAAVLVVCGGDPAGLPTLDAVPVYADPDPDTGDQAEPLSTIDLGLEDVAALAATPDGLVAVTHRNLVRLSAGARDSLDMEQATLLLDTSPLLPWATLGNGGTCLFGDAGAPVSELARQAPTVVVLPAEALAEVVDTDPSVLAPVEEVVVTGDPRAVTEVGLDRVVRRAYLRAETSGVAAVWIGVDGGLPRVGTAVPNATAHVLDERLRPVPPGMVGELYVGGAAVAAGYPARPDLTAWRFVPDPFGAPGARLFRTGERVRHGEDGAVIWLDRTDRQVTIAGQRVDPTRVERALMLDPRVRRAVVMDRISAGRTALLAYVDCDASQLAEVSRAVAGRLARHERPERLTPHPDLPDAGDREALRRLVPDALDGAGGAHLAEWEETIVRIWRRVLDNERVSVTDSFFDVGGHSMLALPVLAGIRDALGVELPVSALFEHPTVRALARAVAGQVDVVPPLQRAEIDRAAGAPLSFGQEALWLLHQMSADSSAYNVTMTVHLPAPVDPAALRSALAGLVRRHEALRTRFVTDPAGMPKQVVEEPYQPEINWPDLDGLAPEQARERAAELTRAAQVTPIDLGSGRPMRVVVTSRPEGCTVTLVVHHIVADGWSLSVLARDLRSLYAGLEVPEPATQMVDFAVWQRRWLVGETLRRQLAYWRANLAGAEMLELPTDRRRPTHLSSASGTVSLRLAPDVSAALDGLAHHHNTTLFAVLAAALAAQLGVYTGQSDVVVGSVLTGRAVAEMADLVGFFANTVALRADLSGDPSFRAVVDQLRRTVLAAFRYQDVPFERVVAELGGHRDGGRNPLFDVMLVHQNVAEAPELSMATRQADAEAAAAVDARFDMELHTALVDGSVGVVLIYRSELFDEATMRSFLDRFGSLLTQVVADPDRRLSTLELGAAGDDAGVEEWNDTAEPLPGASVVALIDARAARSPAADAVIDAHGAVSYADLTARANRLAWRLRGLGVHRGSVVAVCHQRDAELVVALLAILKAGAAYLAVDPNHPPRRVAQILQAARPVLVLTSAQLETKVPVGFAPIHRYDRDDAVLAGLPIVAPEVQLGLDDLVNVIFTSGSTGTPKGVAVTHGGLVRLAAGARHWIECGAGTRMLQMSPLTFDVSTFELWGPLICGGATVAVGVDVLEDDLAAIYCHYGVSAAHLVTPQLDLLVERGLGAFRPLREVVVGGDIIKAENFEAVRRQVPSCRITAAYGPTETAVIASVYQGEDGVDLDGAVPIGRPTANTRWYILDARMRRLPVGVRGEIYIGGPGVARGYLRRSDLTADRFVPDPFGPPGSRLYRTGDLGRLRHDGTMEFLGRVDFQVKIRGYRIELNEIEHALEEHSDVGRAVAVVRQLTTGPALVGYIVPARDAAELDLAALRRHVADRLPAYEVPAILMPLERLPLTASGKIDRKALPEPTVTAPPAGRAPADHLESFIVESWSALLGREISVDDDFFASGGHSLLAVRATNQTRELLGREVPLRMLFDYPTIAGYAEALRKDAESVDSWSSVARRGVVTQHRWASDLLDNQRRVDLYTPPGFDPDRPGRLLVVLDGADFVDVVRVPAIMDGLIDTGRIGPTPALFVSHPDWAARNAELASGVTFVRALIEEAVPMARRWLGVTAARLPVVVAGASYGAVASAAAAMQHPDVVAGAICLAGPFWWAPPGESEGWLVRRALAGDAGAARYYLFAGDGDRAVLREWMRRFHEALLTAGRAVTFSHGPGAHTFATWQERLPEALEAVLSQDGGAQR